MKLFLRKLSPELWISIGALIVSIISFGYSIINGHFQSHKVELAEFMNQGLQNRPLLSIIEAPEVTRVQYKIGALIEEGNIVDSRTTSLEIKTRLRIKNDGNHAARIIFYGFTDIQSGAPEIRNAISNRFSDFKGKLIAMYYSQYYHNIDILPGKEYLIEVSKNVENCAGGNFTMHYFFVYKNEIGNVFDTYYLARFKSKEFTLNPNAESDVIEKALMDSIVFVDDHTSYNMYNKEDSEYLLNMDEQYIENIKH